MWSPDRIPSGGFLSGASSVQRPNLVPGVPLWIANPNVAGGKEINTAAFTIPTGAVQGDLGRNALRGFGATQVDLTLRRQFRLRERLSLQARADFFNIFNHPNFGPPSTTSVLLYSGNRPRCWERRWEAAARMAASIRCIKSAARARCNWL